MGGNIISGELELNFMLVAFQMKFRAQCEAVNNQCTVCYVRVCKTMMLLPGVPKSDDLFGLHDIVGSCVERYLAILPSLY